MSACRHVPGMVRPVDGRAVCVACGQVVGLAVNELEAFTVAAGLRRRRRVARAGLVRAALSYARAVQDARTHSVGAWDEDSAVVRERFQALVGAAREFLAGGGES